jgi:predicted SAM-dependent methyltransferase
MGNMSLRKKIRRLISIKRSAVEANKIVRERLKRSDPVRIHLGCGRRVFPGWINTDSNDRHPGILYVDLLGELPFPDNFAHYVFSEHVHEHLSYKEGLHLLHEIYRVLGPSGVLRLAVPDLDFLVRLYTDQDKFMGFIRRYCRSFNVEGPTGAIALINSVFMEHGHQYLYNFKELTNQLEAAGFREVKEMEIGKSGHDELKDLETNPLSRGETLDLHVACTLCLEASK